MDIDEEAFRAGKVRARHYGQLLVPGICATCRRSSRGRESEELVLADLAAGVVEQMEPDTLYLMGSGSTVAACMGELGLENTLLGCGSGGKWPAYRAGSQRRRDPDPDPRPSLPSDHHPDRRSGDICSGAGTAIEFRRDPGRRARG